MQHHKVYEDECVACFDLLNFEDDTMAYQYKMDRLASSLCNTESNGILDIHMYPVYIN